MLLFTIEQVRDVVEQIASYRTGGLDMMESTDQLIKNHPEIVDTPLRQLVLFTIQMLWLAWEREEDNCQELLDRPVGACKFCGIELKDDGPYMYQHVDGLVCEDCWDERLRVTE